MFMDKLEEVKAAIPHREPFLFVDEIVECEGNRILCKKTFRGDENFFVGHYPGFPVVPGVLQCEAGMQAGAILLTRIFKDEEIGGRLPVVAKMGEVRFKRMVRPGDTLFLEVKFKDRMAGAYFLHVKIIVDGKTSAQFDVACALTEMPEGFNKPGGQS
jgi:3-hydroxyacyl-[acyl-carrier-protein] dehydratase